jgi:hypothetical protein
MAISKARFEKYLNVTNGKIEKAFQFVLSKFNLVK